MPRWKPLCRRRSTTTALAGWKNCSTTPLCPAHTTSPRADEQNFGPRPKAVLLTLGWITLRRTYFYSAQRQEGRFALDAALGLVDSYSPGAARWMCRAAALAGSYQAAGQDLLTDAALDSDARQIQRMVLQFAFWITTTPVSI